MNQAKPDLRISVAQGNITVNADMGVVQVRAKNVMVQADQDIDLQAGRNVNIKAGSRILLEANTVANKGKRGNMISNTFGMNMFAGSFVPGDLIESKDLDHLHHQQFLDLDKQHLIPSLVVESVVLLQIVFFHPLVSVD